MKQKSLSMGHCASAIAVSACFLRLLEEEAATEDAAPSHAENSTIINIF